MVNDSNDAHHHQQDGCSESSGVVIKRFKSYIQGLDERLNGGIPEGQLVLVAGPSGTMKSTLCFNIMYNHALADANFGALYLSLEQRRESILLQMASLGMTTTSALKRIYVSDVCDLRKILKEETKVSDATNWLDAIILQLKLFTTHEKIHSIVIDSLNALLSLPKVEPGRDEIYHFFEALREFNLTTFLITETKYGTENLRDLGDEAYLSDAIIHLNFELDKHTFILLLGVIKMRATFIERTYYPLTFHDNRFIIMG